MDRILCVTYDDVCHALKISGATWRSFCTLSKPLALPFERLPGPRGRPIRAYHLQQILDWLRRACPERLSADVERKLYAAAAQNSQTLEAA